MRLGRSGGEGVWFVLAAAADDAGYPDLGRDLRKISAEEDGLPFGPLSLSSLLIENPDVYPNGLRELRRAERRVRKTGSTEDLGLRAARIAVLASLKRDRALAAEMDRFRGEPYEAPVLAAALRRNPDDPVLAAQGERFILHSPDPGVLKYLPSDKDVEWSPGYAALSRARQFYGRARYGAALREFAVWLKAERDAGAVCDLEGTSPVFAEIALSARRVGEESTWAGFLLDASDELTGSKRYASAYQAGRLYRGLGEYDSATSAFGIAAEAVGSGLDRDRALWHGLRVLYDDPGTSSEDEMQSISRAAGSWSDPNRFTDVLDEFLHRRVRRGEWDLVERAWREWGSSWPAAVRSQGAVILAFAAVERRLDNEPDVVSLLSSAADAAPYTWPGLRAAGLLGRPLPEAPSSAPDSPDTLAGLPADDAVLRLYLRWGLTKPAYAAVMDSPDAFNEMTIRMTAWALASEDPRKSIRVAGLLWVRDGFEPTHEDLLLRYPLPYGSLSAYTAETQDIPVDIFYGLIRTESAWDAGAVSRTGAQGLAQFMPATWDEWIQRLRYPDDADPMDPETNLTLAAAYLEWLNEREWTDGWVDVLVSYNAGGGRLRTWRNELPGLGDDLFGMSVPFEEPRSYIRKVLSAATMYGYLYAGASPRSLHQDWGLDMLEVNE